MINPRETVQQVIESRRLQPIDLLQIGDTDAEYTYLVNAGDAYARTVEDLCELFYPDLKGAKVVEFGSYLGVVSEALARLGFSVTASDIPEFIDNARLQAVYRAHGIETLSVNLRDYRIPLADEFCDVVIMCETLEHLNYNPLPVLLEINRILKSGGIFYISMPNLTSLINRVKMLFGRSIHNSIQDFENQFSERHNMIVGIHWREYTGKEASEMLRYCGFKVVKHDFFSLKVSFVGALVYALCNSLRPYQKIICHKESRVQKQFVFYPAAR